MGAIKQGLAYGALLAATALVAACMSAPPKPKPAGDGAPPRPLQREAVKDAVPLSVVVTRAGNKNPYTVLGKTYYLLPTSEGYREEGIASWYGTKFHGRPTANGEPFNIYGMTAAHKTLPIPAYVRVTNLDNQHTAIVRVNDRGPFHDNRIIDLSYAAAVKLGFEKQGTARVLVETITPQSLRQATAVSEREERFFLQAGAFKSQQLATQLRARLQALTREPVVISDSGSGFYRVRLGPLPTMQQVQQLTDRLLSMNIKPSLIAEQLPE